MVVWIWQECVFSGALVLSSDLHSKNIHQSHLLQIPNHNLKTTQLVTVPIDEVMRKSQLYQETLKPETHPVAKRDGGKTSARDIQGRSQLCLLHTHLCRAPSGKVTEMLLR